MFTLVAYQILISLVAKNILISGMPEPGLSGVEIVVRGQFCPCNGYIVYRTYYVTVTRAKLDP